MVDEKTCNRCRYCDLPAGQDPCYTCLIGKDRPKFVPLTPEQDDFTKAKKAKIVGRLSSWQYTIGYVQGILVESDIKDKSATDLLKGMAADIEGFVSDVLNDME